MTTDLCRRDQDIVTESFSGRHPPCREIAQRPDVSERTGPTRVAWMQEKGCTRLSVVCGPTALGIACNVIVMLNVPPQPVNAVYGRLTELPHVRFVNAMPGSSDISIRTLHGSFEDLHSFVSDGILEISPDVQSVETFQVSEVIKSERNWLEWFRNGLIPSQPAETPVRRGKWM